MSVPKSSRIRFGGILFSLSSKIFCVVLFQTNANSRVCLALGSSLIAFTKYWPKLPYPTMPTLTFFLSIRKIRRTHFIDSLLVLTWLERRQFRGHSHHRILPGTFQIRKNFLVLSVGQRMQEGVSRSIWPVAVALSAVLVSIIAPAQAACKCTMPSGYTYDLSKLGSQKMVTADGSWTYEYIPCAATSCGDKGLVGLCEHLLAS